MNNNLLLCTDVYKMGHMDQYPEGTTKVYSYLTARSGKSIDETVFFGLQYYLKEYLTRRITADDVEEFLSYKRAILGNEGDSREKLMGLVRLGYLPIEIKAVPEGLVMPVKNVLLTVTNTHPDFAWVVGFFESLLLKLWSPITVASFSRKLRLLCQRYALDTCDNQDHLSFQVHDFGYRGVSSEETAMIAGAAHLVNFMGSDTILGMKFLREYYAAENPVALSVPATEHSVMCAYTEACEFNAFERMLDLYPSGFVSIVSDTYNLWNVLADFVPRLKSRILERDGRVVFRPDSGDPQKIICGNNGAAVGTPEYLGALEILWKEFGGTVNSKGYRVLNPKVGLIYGDGIFYERFDQILAGMRANGFASSNLVVGIGGLLLQQHSRDEQGFAVKATYCEVNGESRDLQKDPVTDHSKKSLKGRMGLFVNEGGSFVTVDELTAEQEQGGLLTPVFRDGQILHPTSLADIRALAVQGLPSFVLDSARAPQAITAIPA